MFWGVACAVAAKYLKANSIFNSDGAKLRTRIKMKCANCATQAHAIRISNQILDECFPEGIYLSETQGAT